MTLLLLFLNAQTNKAIYGIDDRKDIYEVSNSRILNVAKATAAQIPFYQHIHDLILEAIKVHHRNYIELQVGTNEVMESLNDKIILEYEKPLCEEVRFRNQLALAQCSGFLVAPDVLVTAGHCVVDNTLDYSIWVFDYKIDPATNSSTIPLHSIYSSEIIETVYNEIGEFSDDFAILRLHPLVEYDNQTNRGPLVDDRNPLLVRKNGSKIRSSDDIYVIGHPNGIPTKVTGKASILPTNSGHDKTFRANTDTFSGNSGSVVYDMGTNLVEGILVRGHPVAYVADGECMRPKQCLENGYDCTGSVVYRITNLADKLDALEYK